MTIGLMGLKKDFPLHRHIDHTVLAPTVAVEEYLETAKKVALAQTAAFCVPPFVVKDVAAVLRGTQTKTQTVIGFPLGFQTTKTKVYEAREAIENGAGELDLVVNRSWIRSGRLGLMQAQVEAVVRAAGGVPVKTILETSDLTIEEILAASEAAAAAGAAVVKTSTGFFGEGARLDIVRRIKEHVGDRIAIKASGGIRDLETAWAFIQAGADRLGTSSGLKILEDFRR